MIATLAISHKHIDPETMSTVLYAMALTSILTSYQIKYSQNLFLLFDRTMNRLGVRGREAKLEEEVTKGEAYPIVVLGYHRGARAFTDAIAREQPELLKKILVVDFNLEILKELQGQGIHGMFGDVSSLDTLMHAHIDKAGLILSTIPDLLLKGTDNVKLVRMCRRVAPEAAIVATADFKDQIPALKEAGATQVLLPYSLAGEQLAGGKAGSSDLGASGGRGRGRAGSGVGVHRGGRCPPGSAERSRPGVSPSISVVTWRACKAREAWSASAVSSSRSSSVKALPGLRLSA